MACANRCCDCNNGEDPFDEALKAPLTYIPLEKNSDDRPEEGLCLTTDASVADNLIQRQTGLRNAYHPVSDPPPVPGVVAPTLVMPARCCTDELPAICICGRLERAVAAMEAMISAFNERSGVYAETGVYAEGKACYRPNILSKRE